MFALALWTKRFTTLAVLALVLTAAATTFSAIEAGSSDVRGVAKAAVLGPLEAWYWRWCAIACAGLSGLALVVTASESWLRRRRGGRLEFRSLGGKSVKEALAETAHRLSTCFDDEVDAVLGFEQLVRGATAIGASDIHLSPSAAGLRVTYRVEGRLHPVVTLKLAVAPVLATRVKVLANLDTYVNRTPQDGRLNLTLEDQRVEMRVSTLPTEQGERVVLRIVSGSRGVRKLGDLGFSEEVLRRFSDVLSRSQGIIFVTGPVGNGKTTTLYSALQHISTTRGQTTSMVTIEDPIELELPFAAQTRMNAKAGMTFASTLRSVLRQDPNVLMVGEIRDRETAEIATQAGLSGHLILTTVHAESAAGPFARLIDMDVEPFAVASATLASLSQRLLRELCPACRRPTDPTPPQREALERLNVALPSGTYYEAYAKATGIHAARNKEGLAGCGVCDGEGYLGRIVVAEILWVSQTVRSAIIERRSTKEIEALALAEGMVPLLATGVARASTGATSLSEVLRVAG